MSSVITFTLNPALDKSCEVDQVVAEHKLRCGEPAYHAGGGGLNVSRAIHKLGGQSVAYWTSGGAIGELLARFLAEEAVDQRPIAIEAMTRENLIVYERSSGQQYRFGMPGSRLAPSEAERCLAELRQLDPKPAYLVLSGSLPPGVDNDWYARAARAVGPACRVLLDSSYEPLRQGLDSKIYLIKPNIRELGQLAGRPIENDSQIAQVARSLIQRHGVEVVVTSLGSGGVALTTAETHEHIRAPTVHICSKVGAGDSMVAGIVFALSQGRPVTEAVRYGVAAGSAAVMTEGTELCRRSDTDHLYAQMQDVRSADP